MKFIPPLNYLPGDENDEDRAHWNANPASNIQAEQDGSYPSAIGFEAVQREIVNAIIAAGLVPDDGSYTQLAAAIVALQSNVPTGIMLPHTGDAAPTGFIFAEGAALSRATYANLWTFAQASGNLAASEGAKEDGEYGPGDGGSTFTTPDMRGIFLRGWDDGRGIDSGRQLGSDQTDSVGDHDHTYEGVFQEDGSDVNASGSYAPMFDKAGASPSSLASAITVTDAVIGAAGETRPLNTAMPFCIKY